MPDMTIVIPHKSTPMNDKALQINLESLLRNTVHSYELIIDTECPKDPYKIWNEAATFARGKILVFTNSDVIMARGWDEPFFHFMEDNAILVGYLVEPGNIGVASENIQADFGRTPYNFDQQRFEDFVTSKVYSTPAMKHERGWYMPCAFYKDWFNWTGGFDTTLGFPNPNDILFWNKVTSQLGTKLLRVNSFAYHFQALSTR